MDGDMFKPLVALAWIGLGSIALGACYGIYKLISCFI